ncbi:hypothetical protein Brsp07_03461 [Brucella sp. NBRC 14130]
MRFGFAAAAMALLSSVRGFFGGSIAMPPIVPLGQPRGRLASAQEVQDLIRCGFNKANF